MTSTTEIFQEVFQGFRQPTNSEQKGTANILTSFAKKLDAKSREDHVRRRLGQMLRESGLQVCEATITRAGGGGQQVFSLTKKQKKTIRDAEKRIRPEYVSQHLSCILPIIDTSHIRARRSSAIL